MREAFRTVAALRSAQSTRGSLLLELLALRHQLGVLAHSDRCFRPSGRLLWVCKYDFAIYGHIAHQETPADNVEIRRKFRRVIKPGGTLVVNDFILSDDRTGHPMAMLFAAQMLLV